MTLLGPTTLVVLASLVAALCYAFSSVAKHASAGRGPEAPTLRPGSIARFVAATVRHPLWLAGIVADGAGLALQVTALHLGALSMVQPLLLSGLVFAILLRGIIDRHVPARQLLWALLVTASLGGFLALSSSGGGHAKIEPIDRLPAVITAACGVLVVAVVIAVGSRSSRVAVRAGLMGAAAGTIYAATAALMKGVSDVAARGFLPLLASWQLYTLIVVGAAGLVVGQISFRSGPLAVSLPVADTVDPLFSVVVGVAIFDERLRLGPGHGALLALLLVVLAVAVIRLATLAERSAPGDDPASTGSAHGSAPGDSVARPVDPAEPPRQPARV